MDMFDDDDTLMYEPALTAAVIMTGDDEEAEKAALEVRSTLAAGLQAEICLNQFACWPVIWTCHLQLPTYVHEVQDVYCACGQLPHQDVHAGLQRSRDY